MLKRKRKHAGSEEDKWKDMYRVLFPDDDEADMPSPCECSPRRDPRQKKKKNVLTFPDHEDAQGLEWEARRVREFHEYERYLRRELPRSVRQRLEIAASQISGPLENALRAQLVDIVRDCQSRVFQQYRGAEEDGAAATATAITSPLAVVSADSAPPASSEPFLPTTTTGGSAADIDISAFYPQPPLAEGHGTNAAEMEMFFTAMFTTGLDGDYHPASDSGYGGSTAVGAQDGRRAAFSSSSSGRFAWEGSGKGTGW